METVVRMDGAVEITLNRLVELGYYKTKSEAIRAGVLELGKEHEVLTPQQLEDELAVRKMRKMEKQAGKDDFVPLEKVAEEYGLKKENLEK